MTDSTNTKTNVVPAIEIAIKISASDEKQFSQEGMAWGGGNGVFTYLIQSVKNNGN